VSYKLIEDYGIIGDLHTVALVGIDGSIDWCCLPHFDSPSIFAAILDDEKGGYFKISAVSPERCKQLYLPDTNVLITRFFTADGIAELIDFMPVEARNVRYAPPNYHQIIRRVNAVAGHVRFRLECFPAFNYARDKHEIHPFQGDVCQPLRLHRVGLTGAAYYRRRGRRRGVFASARQYGDIFSPSGRPG
jgi:GH15 family glucan-1,4-alpha-glucosidase